MCGAFDGKGVSERDLDSLTDAGKLLWKKIGGQMK